MLLSVLTNVAKPPNIGSGRKERTNLSMIKFKSCVLIYLSVISSCQLLI